MIRGFFGVIVGFLTMAIVVMLGTFVAARAMLEGNPFAPGGQRPTSAYLAVNLVVSAFAVMLGGFVARSIAGKPGLVSVGALAGFVCLMSIVSMIGARNAPPNGQPSWYLPVIALIGPLGVILGGWTRRS